MAHKRESGSNSIEGLRRVGIVIAIAVGSVALSACASAEPAPGPSTSVPIETPAPTPNATETQAPVVPLPENLVKYKDMSDTDFAQLPFPEQSPYISYLLLGMPEFWAEYADQSGIPSDAYVPASADDSAQEAANYTGRLSIYALSLDEQDALKVMTFSLVQGTSSSIYNDLAQDIKQSSNRKPRAIADGGSYALPNVISPGTAQDNCFNNVKLQYPGPNNTNVYDTRLCFTELPGYDGKPFGVWQDDV